MMGGPCKAVHVLHGLGGQGGGDVGGGGGVGVGGGDDRVSGTAVSLGSGLVSSGSLCSSWSSLTDDDDEATSPPEGGPKSSSSSLASSDSMQLDGDGGPLYELSPLLAHLPVRTGLSKYYQGKSQSFTSLSDATCVADLAKKTTPYSRMKACRGYAAAGLGKNRPSRYVPGPCSKTIAKTTPRGSSDRLLSRARSKSLLHSSGKPPASQSNKELYKF